MTSPVDYSTLSDEELDKIISGGVGGTSATASKAREAIGEKSIRATGEPRTVAQDLSGIEQFGLGVTMPSYDIMSGAGEKARMLFPGAGQEKAVAEEVAKGRGERRKIIKEVKATPMGQFGSFIGEIAPALAVRSAAVPQALYQGFAGFLRGGPDAPTSLTNELATSSAQGGIEGATTGALTALGGAAGKAINAARGVNTAAGARAVDIDEAYKRLGINPPLTIGQLYPLSPTGIMERNLPGYAQNVDDVAAALRKRLETTKQVPTATGVGTVDTTVPGGQLAEDLAAAVRERMAQGRAKYEAVDQFVAQNGLPPVIPAETFNQFGVIAKKLTPKGQSPENNLALGLLKKYDETAFDWLRGAAGRKMTPQQAVQAGVPMSTYHDMRVATSRAINQLDTASAVNPTADVLTARAELIKLKKALDQDAETWATASAGNKEAMDLYNNAKQFYSDVVAPSVIDNRFARKVVSKNKPFQSADEMFAAANRASNYELIDRLLPTMPQSGQDALKILREVPDVGATLASRTPPTPSPRGGLGALATTALGHPLVALSEVAPGLRWGLSRSALAKRLAAAENPVEAGGALGRALSVGSQYPQDDAASGVQRLLGMR